MLDLFSFKTLRFCLVLGKSLCSTSSLELLEVFIVLGQMAKFIETLSFIKASIQNIEAGYKLAFVRRAV